MAAWSSVISSIVTMLLPFMAKLITSYFESKDANTKAKAKWFDFIEAMAESENGESERLRQSFNEQLKRLKSSN